MKQVVIKDNCLLVGKMQNISYGLNEDCLAAMSKTNEEWKCGNAQVQQLLYQLLCQCGCMQQSHSNNYISWHQ